MSGLVKRNENGRRAEYRTEAFLLDHFWTLKLAVNLGGADFLIRPATRFPDSQSQPSDFQRVAVIQARSWEAGHEIEVPASLIEGPDRRPHRESFVVVSVTDEVGVVSDLFFSAEEVQSLFRRRSNSSGEEEFAFSITADRNFGQFRRTNRIKAGMITSALTTTDSAGSQALMTQASKLASSGSAWPPLVQVSQIQWQMRYRESLFEFELIDDPESGFAVVHGWKSDASGQRNLTPLATERPMDEYQFDPLNEEWVPRSR